jgi:hypothetical protein
MAACYRSIFVSHSALKAQQIKDDSIFLFSWSKNPRLATHYEFKSLIWGPVTQVPSDKFIGDIFGDTLLNTCTIAF